MEIRAEQPSDQAGIRALHVASFPSDAEARLVDALRAAGRLAVSLVAIEKGEVVGHVGLSPLPGFDGLGLAPLAVSESFQKQGIGARLVRGGLEAARGLGARFVVVLGDPEYYSRFGFAPARRWGLFDAYDGGFAFQVIELAPGGIPQSAGLISYAPEFAVFDGSEGAG